MPSSVLRGVLLSIAVAALGSASPALALVEEPLPLALLLRRSSFVFVAKVDRISAERRAIVLAVEADLKGMLPTRRLAVDLAGDNPAEANKLYARLGKENVLLVTLTEEIDENGKFRQYVGLFYLEGSWFQILGIPSDAGKVSWRYTHAEPYLRRTFKGTTADLRRTIDDALALRQPPPALDMQVPPGLGPELAAEERAFDLMVEEVPPAAPMAPSGEEPAKHPAGATPEEAASATPMASSSEQHGTHAAGTEVAPETAPPEGLSLATLITGLAAGAAILALVLIGLVVVRSRTAGATPS